MPPVASELVTPPTTLIGHVDPAWRYALGDVMETIPDLTPALAVQTYSQMRRDPQLAAILTAYTLPILRATWAVDPAGCRDEVAQLVADDLGLPVLGDDQPGAARTRGVAWQDHLRAALLHLTFGHAGFELEADVSSGQARLVGLFERTQATITHLHLDEQGRLLGVSQDSRAYDDAPQIPADRLVWYVRDREGTNWYGTSLLRPSFAAFTLKREALRVLATSSRRFGMGVPTVEWASGVTPTPAQMTAAQEAASAARVGDQSGLALPPGATLVLKGLSGGSPDTLAFVKFLNAEMAKSTLAQFLDLGQTETGSRALGQSFIDLFTLSIAAVASYCGEVATREIAARIVSWNWRDEPVPRVVVTDVGTKHEFTAEAIQALMQAGALQADPALEDYMRKAYQLPARDPGTPWRPMTPMMTGRPRPAAVDAEPTQPVAASTRPRGRAKRSQASGQGALFAAAGDDDSDGAAEHQQGWEQTTAAILAAWPVVAAPLVDDLADQAADASKSGDLTRLAEIAATVAGLAALVDALTPSFVGVAAESAGHVLALAASAGVTVRKPTKPGAVVAAQLAEVTASLIAAGYAQAATRAALQVAGGTRTEVRTAVAATLTDMGTSEAGLVADQIGAGLTGAQNAGRVAVFEAAGRKLAGLRSVETLDKNTCVNCAAANGREYPTLTAALEDYPVGGLKTCLGRGRCRGFLAPIWASR